LTQSEINRLRACQFLLARRLATIPGVGPIATWALAATITDPTLFRSGRHLAAWLGLVPRQHSTGGKAKLARITKIGDQYLRKLLVVGMTAVIRSAWRTKAPAYAWVDALLERRPARLVSVALANKAARTAWVILIRGENLPDANGGGRRTTSTDRPRLPTASRALATALLRARELAACSTE
jgi:transposase